MARSSRRRRLRARAHSLTRQQAARDASARFAAWCARQPRRPGEGVFDYHLRWWADITEADLAIPLPWPIREPLMEPDRET